METATADQIRSYVDNAVIGPARSAGAKVVNIRARDIHRHMGLKQRMPAVCSALDAQKFQIECRVTLVRRDGPKQGPCAVWVFAIEP